LFDGITRKGYVSAAQQQKQIEIDRIPTPIWTLEIGRKLVPTLILRIDFENQKANPVPTWGPRA
jgi:hypothetical protein